MTEPPSIGMKTEAEGRLDEMFLTGTFNDGEQLLSNIVFTRDPRLYESVIVNGLPGNLGWSSVSVGGDPYELWVGRQPCRIKFF